MISGVICLAHVFIVFLGQCAASDQFVSPRVAGNLTLEMMGGNDVLLIAGPVSELGDLCYKNWTTAVVSFYLAGRRQCIRTRSIFTCRCGLI